MLDYVNSFAGTSLDIAGLKLTIDTLSPLSNFEFQKNYFDNQNSALYLPDCFRRSGKINVDKGVLPNGKYDGRRRDLASSVYHNLVALKQAADDLLKRTEGSNLSAQNQALLEKAKQFYAWQDYLDAYRLLRVACNDFRAIQRSSDPPPPSSRMDAGAVSPTAPLYGRTLSAPYTPSPAWPFIGVWWYAASQLPRSRLVTPLEVGSDI